MPFKTIQFGLQSLDTASDKQSIMKEYFINLSKIVPLIFSSWDPRPKRKGKTVLSNLNIHIKAELERLTTTIHKERKKLMVKAKINLTISSPISGVMLMLLLLNRRASDVEVEAPSDL